MYSPRPRSLAGWCMWVLWSYQRWDICMPCRPPLAHCSGNSRCCEWLTQVCRWWLAAGYISGHPMGLSTRWMRLWDHLFGITSSGAESVGSGTGQGRSVRRVRRRQHVCVAGRFRRALMEERDGRLRSLPGSSERRALRGERQYHVRLRCGYWSAALKLCDKRRHRVITGSSQRCGLYGIPRLQRLRLPPSGTLS